MVNKYLSRIFHLPHEFTSASSQTSLKWQGRDLKNNSNEILDFAWMGNQLHRARKQKPKPEIQYPEAQVYFADY